MPRIAHAPERDAARDGVPGRLQNRRRKHRLCRKWTGAITTENYEKARQSELKIIPVKVDATDAPYLVDFIHEELLKDYSEEELMNNGFRRKVLTSYFVIEKAIEIFENALPDAGR